MDLQKIVASELSGMDTFRLREVERDVRSELQTLRMDIFNERKLHSTKIRKLKRGLARVLTVLTQKQHATSHQG